MLQFMMFIVLFPLIWHISEACKCIPIHPQTHFCQSDFSLQITPIQKVNLGAEIRYKIIINKMYKAKPSAITAIFSGQNAFIYTDSSSASCGVELQLFKKYIITGYVFAGKAQITLCDYSNLLSSISLYHTIGFEYLYKLGCKCQIYRCHGPNCTPNKTRCNLDYAYKPQCYTDLSSCHKNGAGKCVWIESPQLSQCL